MRDNENAKNEKTNNLRHRVVQAVDLAETQIGGILKEANEIGQVQAGLIRVVALDKLDTLRQKIHFSALEL